MSLDHIAAVSLDSPHWVLAFESDWPLVQARRGSLLSVVLFKISLPPLFVRVFFFLPAMRVQVRECHPVLFLCGPVKAFETVNTDFGSK